MNTEQITKTWALYDSRNNQVRWHYVSNDSPDLEPDKYIDVNLGDFSWTPGTLDRTAGTIYRPAAGSLVLIDADGAIFEHEVGNDADGAALEAFISFGLYALANGEQDADVMRFIPDCERQTGDLSVELYSKMRPNSDSNLDSVTLTLSEGEEDEDCRMQAVHFGFTIRSDVIGGDFRLGTPALDVQYAGER
jgi:hypothetical protein